MIGRRCVLAGFAASGLAAPASSHAVFGQWVAYRRKHLLIGCHRQDSESHALAAELEVAFEHLLPSAKARAARAPHPQRLASLLGTDQLEIAVLERSDAAAMASGLGSFAPYGALPLTVLADMHLHLLVAHQAFPLRHGFMVASAADGSGWAKAPGDPGTLPWHAGAQAYRAGEDLEALPRDG